LETIQRVKETRNQIAELVGLDTDQRREFISENVRECDNTDVLATKLLEVDILIRRAESKIGLGIFQRQTMNELRRALSVLSFIYEFAKVEITKNGDPTILVELS
jgi:hypothetical protein